MGNNEVTRAEPIDRFEHDASPAEVVHPGGAEDFIEPVDIGLGRPLCLELASMFPGDDNRGKATLVTSAVRRSSDHDAAPLSAHRYYQDTEYGRLLPTMPADPGSDIIYYTPGALDDSLDVQVQYSFDRFDREKYEAWTSAAARAAKLPVFLAGGTAGGPGGAAASLAFITAAEQVISIIWRRVDHFLDSDNDWKAAWKLNLNQGGRTRSKAGYMLFFEDDGNENEVVPILVGEDRTGAFETRGNAYVVDTRDGTLRYRDQPNERVLHGEPYVLAFVDGAPRPHLKKWQAAAVSATLMDRFLKADNSNAPEDLTDILEVYNDYVFSRQVAVLDELIKEADPDSDGLKAAQAKRKGALKNIQNEQMRKELQAQ